MTTSLSAIEASSIKEARRILRASEQTAGTNRAYFERVVELMGADPSAARELASRWNVFARYGDYDAYAIRAKAVGERLDGQWAAAAESFLEAGRRAASELDAAVFATGAVDSLARAGAVKRAVAVGNRLARRLNDMGEPGLAGRVRLNLGNALLHQDAYRRASTQFARAAPALKAAGFAREAAAAELGISGAQLFGGSVSVSIEAATNAAATFDELGDTHFSALARLNIAHGHLLQGRGDDALTLLLEVSPLLAGSAADVARCEEFLGDAYMRLNLFEAAVDAYTASLASPALHSMPLNKANCTFGLGLVNLALGKTVEARRQLSRAAKGFRKLGNDAWAGAALKAASEAMRDRQALTASAEAVELLRASRSWYHLCTALLQRGERFGDQNDLERAAKLISQHGYGFLRWRIDAAHARRRSGKTGLRHWRKMFEGLMADRLLTRSTSARTAFLRDKQEALSEYLEHLLDGPKPMVDEAMSVVARSRSVALIDEMLAVETPSLSEGARAALEDLRIAVAEEMEIGPAGSRLRRGGRAGLSQLQRRWLQTAFAQTTFASASPRTARDGVAVYIQTNRGFYAIFEGKAVRLEVSENELRKMLSWLEFDLLSPMVGGFDQKTLTRRVAQLREKLLAPVTAHGMPKAIVPDGVLWAVPWNLILDTEAPILSNPSFGELHGRVGASRVVVWAHDPGGLPNVESEVAAVLEHYPKAEVVHDLTSARKSLESPVDLLHVACHGTSRHDNPMYSGLELEGGLLLAAEIASSKASVGQVTLSACDTGRVSLRVRSEPDGLVRSFQATGAQSVIASQWPLDDAAAALTMRTYYKELASGSDVRGAMTKARSACRVEFPHPYYWAPLTIFGGYHRRDHQK